MVARDTDPPALLDEIVRQRVTHVILVPAILAAFLSVPDVASRDYSHVEALTYCASPIAPSLLRRCLETFPVPIVQGYGLTECSPTISILDDREHRDTGNPHRLASAGKPIPGTEVQIADPGSGKPLGAGHVGEVLVRSRQVMLGYWDGTGPDSFIRGGDNVYAAEVDVPGVLRHCREHLAEYKCPASVALAGELPRNALGKVAKDKLRERAMASEPAAQPRQDSTRRRKLRRPRVRNTAAKPTTTG